MKNGRWSHGIYRWLVVISGDFSISKHLILFGILVGFKEAQSEIKEMDVYHCGTERWVWCPLSGVICIFKWFSWFYNLAHKYMSLLRIHINVYMYVHMSVYIWLCVLTIIQNFSWIICISICWFPCVKAFFLVICEESF